MTTPPTSGEWVGSSDLGLLTDLYQLTMLQAYWHENHNERGAFSLYFRELPPHRNYVVAAGLDSVLGCLEALRFSEAQIEYLDSLPQFQHGFLNWLQQLRFTGDVYAVPEGTPLFGNEPLLEVEAPLAEAQLAETLIMNQMHVQSVLASKAARIVRAAGGKPVVDFGLRRMHGADAGLKGARAMAIAGVSATSNVLAGQRYGLELRGTMAHSFVQSYDDEYDAFRAFAALYPEGVLLVDTYDTLQGVRRVIRLAEELGQAFRIRAIRLDSGDLADLAVRSRGLLDEAGLTQIGILVSGGLDEHRIRALQAAGAPIDGYGVGTKMSVSEDSPVIDLVYKMVEYAGRGRLKSSTGKAILPGPKQIFRRYDADGTANADTLARRTEQLDGEPLLQQVMREGKRLKPGRVTLAQAIEHARASLATLPPTLHGLIEATPYPVYISDALRRYQQEILEELSDESD